MKRLHTILVPSLGTRRPVLSHIIMWVSAICAAGFGIAYWAHLYLAVPPSLKCPAKTQLLGRFTFLTIQSNVFCGCYHALRLVAPSSFLAVHGYPLAFALGFNLTVLYYALDYFVGQPAAGIKPPSLADRLELLLTASFAPPRWIRGKDGGGPVVDKQGLAMD